MINLLKKEEKIKKNKSATIIKKIKKIFLKNKMKSICDYEKDEYYYLIYEFVILTYSEKTNIIDVSFNVSTRPDLASFFILLLNKIYKFSDINIIDMHLREDNGHILIGSKCIVKHQDHIKKLIINDFLEEQIQSHYLKNNHLGVIC